MNLFFEYWLKHPLRELYSNWLMLTIPIEQATYCEKCPARGRLSYPIKKKLVPEMSDARWITYRCIVCYHEFGRTIFEYPC